jgi:hypothetical protein
MNMNKNPKEIIIAGGGWKSPEHMSFPPSVGQV